MNEQSTPGGGQAAYSPAMSAYQVKRLRLRLDEDRLPKGVWIDDKTRLSICVLQDDEHHRARPASRSGGHGGCNGEGGRRRDHGRERSNVSASPPIRPYATASPRKVPQLEESEA